MRPHALPRRRRRPGGGRAVLAALAGGRAAALPGAGAAELPTGHPVPGRPRALAERMERADVVALVAVERVETARLRLRLERALLGEPPGRFAVKRAPAAPPPLSEGDRAILFLRGARPPYVLVDAPSETIRVADDAMAARWTEALRAVREHAGEPERLLTHYRSWIDEGPPTLRELGLWALLERFARAPAGFGPVARERARAAADPALPSEARRSSAVLATRTPGGTAALLEALAARPGAAEPGVVGTAVLAGARRGRPELEPALRAALAHGTAAVREAALRGLASGRSPLGEGAAALVERAAREDPSAEVRRRAERLLTARRTAP